MTPEQELLRDKLKYGGDVYKHIESLRLYIRENENIQSGLHDARMQELIQQQNSELKREYNRLLDIRCKIDTCIRTIDDEELKALLIMRYLGHISTLEIAEKMHYGRNTVNRKHKAALNKLIESGADKILDY